MKWLALLILCPGFEAEAEAANLFCRADFDESSHYELRLGIVPDGRSAGPAEFSYITEDGLNLKAELKVSEATVSPGAPLHLKAQNENMRVEADAAPAGAHFNGALRVFFSLDNVSPVETEMSCVLE